jgi:hypothetical protein
MKMDPGAKYGDSAADKYAKKLSEKKMQAATRHSVQSGLSSGSSSSSNITCASTTEKQKLTTGMGWAVENGAPDMIKYLKMRQVDLALLLPPGTTQGSFCIDRFMQQMSQTIPVVMDLDSSQHTSMAPLPATASIDYLCGQMEMRPGEVMVSSV